MEDYDRENDWSAQSNFSNIQDSTGNVRLSQAVAKTHTLHAFYLIAGVSQVLLGLSVIVVSILGLISPIWVSLLLTMGASVTTLTGLYLVYMMVSKSFDSHSLLRDAMKRVMKAKN